MDGTQINWVPLSPVLSLRPLLFFFISFIPIPLNSTLWLLLVLYSGITPKGLRKPYGMLDIKSGSAMYKKCILSAVLSLGSPQASDFGCFVWEPYIMVLMLTPISAFSDHLGRAQRDHMWWQALYLGWPHARHASYLLFYYSDLHSYLI